MNRAFQGVYLIALGGLLLGGIAVLLQWGLEKGDAYPRYSTLRADPLGTRAFYESLDRLHPNEVSQNFRPLGREYPNKETTWFFLGVNRDFGALLSKAGDAHLRQILSQGGDVVVTLRAVGGLLHANASESSEDPETSSPEDDPLRAEIREKRALERARFLLYGLDAEWITRQGRLSTEASIADADPAAWPDVYQSRSSIAFEIDSGDWQTLYAHDHRPLVIRRDVGRGSITLVNDSYAFSNEALFHQRQSAFLKAIIGKNKRFVFDETHLGTTRNRGVMDLIRDYGLQGVLLSFVLLALLYVWRAGSSLLPKYSPAHAEQDQLLGESSHEGFEHFLAHHVPDREIVSQCLSEWQQSWGSEPQRNTSLSHAIDHAAAELKKSNETKKTPIEQYNSLREILTQKHFS